VLVQANYSGILDINGAPVGRELQQPKPDDINTPAGDGSCMIVVATEAPLQVRKLRRIAERALHGLARTGSYMRHGSGEYAIAFSTGYRIDHRRKVALTLPALVSDHVINGFFRAVVEATQEAVYNAMFMATSMTGRQGRHVPAIPLDEVVRICERYNVLNLHRKLPGDTDL
jgi:D-aminopeptidase